jgi:coatomer subunit beta'
VVELWKEDLGKHNKKAASSLADPTGYENLFPEFQEALKAEQVRSTFAIFVFVFND